MKITVAAILAFLLQTPAPQPPPRVSIEGSVVRAGTNEPISRVQVTVQRVTAAQPALAAPPTGARGANPAAAASIPAVLTDSTGKFSIKDLPPGSYRLAAARNGYSKQEYGQRSTRSPGTVLNLQPGQNLNEIVFRLTPAGTVSGRVTDLNGEPLAGVTVSIMRSAYSGNGKRTFQTAGTARTNDLGEYRLYWITPGRYFLNASTSRGYMDSVMQSAIASAGAQQRAEDNTGNVNASQAAVESLLGINSNEVAEPGFSTTYYPNTTDATRAVAIDVPAGAELRAMDVTLLRQPTFRIQGKVYDARTNQIPQTAIVQLVNRNDSATLPKPASSYDSTTGAFEIREVPAGEYSVMAVVANVTNAPTGGAAAIGIAMAQVDVSGDVSNVVATVRPGVKVEGRVTLDGGAPLAGLAGLDRIKVRIGPAAEGGTPTMTQPPSISPDGTFVLDNTPPGDYRIGLTGAAPNIYMKAARYASADVLNEPMSVSADSPSTLEILLSPNAAQVTGTLVDRDSKPVPTTQVVLIPDRQRDRRDLFKPTVTDSNGRFTINGVPPGDYRLFSWEDIEPFAYTDPEVLKQYESRATVVKISEGAKLNQEVKIIPASN